MPDIDFGGGSQSHPIEPVYAKDIIAQGPTYDVRQAGAQLDGQTNDTEEFLNAVSTAKQRGVPLRVPKGEMVIDSVVIDKENTPLTIVGDGIESKILADSNHDYSSPDENLIDIDDEDGEVEDFILTNIQLDGQGVSGASLVNYEDNDFAGRGVILDHIWAHDGAEAFFIAGTGITLQNIWSWNNSAHGVGINNTGSETERIPSVYNVRAWNNDFYGIDCSTGGIFARNIITRNNGDGGGKTSTGATLVDVTGYFEGEPKGWEMTGKCDHLKIHATARNCVEEGFRFAGGSRVDATVTARNCNTGGSDQQVLVDGSGTSVSGHVWAIDGANGNGMVLQNNAEWISGMIWVENNPSFGVASYGGGYFDVETLVARDNGLNGVYVNEAADTMYARRTHFSGNSNGPASGSGSVQHIPDSAYSEV